MTEAALGDIGRLGVEDAGDIAIARLHGEVDLSNSDQLVRELEAAVSPAAVGLVLDLSSADYVDSAGIRSIFEVERHLHQRRQLLGLVVPAESLLRPVLVATGVHEAIAFYGDGEAALAGLRERHRSRTPGG